MKVNQQFWGNHTLWPTWNPLLSNLANQRRAALLWVMSQELTNSYTTCVMHEPHTHPSLMVSLFITLQRASYKVPQFIYLVSLFHFVKLESKKWDSVMREDFLVYFTFVRLHVKPQTLRQLALSTTFLPFSTMCQVDKSSWLTDNLCRQHRWRVNWNINMMIGALTAPSRRGKV